MHFFYLDESGCTGADLANPEQPIFVLGGISVRDEGWRKTTDQIQSLVSSFFGGNVPANFELRASELNLGRGHFVAFPQDTRNRLFHDVFNLLAERSHGVHYVAIDKPKLAAEVQGDEHGIFPAAIPYMLGFNYLTSYIERLAKEMLNQSARAMVILDVKDTYQDKIDALTHFRRYEVTKARRLKWVVEFSYPVGSKRHPMVQVSDLAIYVIRKFLELENGYANGWSYAAKKFFASGYEKVQGRVKWKNLIDVSGPEERPAHALLKKVQSKPRHQWKRHYDL